ncbi:MAG: VOC family protein [Pyrinomonadaceae bacterium]
MPKILQNHYVLAAHDTEKLSQFFMALGFKVISEPSGWVFVEKDNCMVMIGECRDAALASELGDHSYFGYLRVDDADSYYQDLAAQGVKIMSSLTSQPWGMREFGVASPEGHRITIGQWVGE